MHAFHEGRVVSFAQGKVQGLVLDRTTVDEQPLVTACGSSDTRRTNISPDGNVFFLKMISGFLVHLGLDGVLELHSKTLPGVFLDLLHSLFQSLHSGIWRTVAFNGIEMPQGALILDEFEPHLGGVPVQQVSNIVKCGISPFPWF